VESETISIILPTSNRQDQLVNRIESLIENVSDLCTQLQIVIVDDGSTDATPEILEDLRRTYPQIETLRTEKKHGPKHAAGIGLYKAVGAFVFIHESYESIDTNAMRQLWSLRNDKNLVVARAGTRTRRIDNVLLDQLAKWGKRIEDSIQENWAASESIPAPAPHMVTSGLQMVRRDSLTKLARVDAKEPAFEVSHLSQRSLVRAPTRVN